MNGVVFVALLVGAFSAVTVVSGSSSCGLPPALDSEWDAIVVGGDYMIQEPFGNNTVLAQMMNLYDRATGAWTAIDGPLFWTNGNHRRVGDEVATLVWTHTMGLIVAGYMRFEAAGTGIGSVNGRVNVSGIGLYDPATKRWNNMRGGLNQYSNPPVAVVFDDETGVESIYVGLHAIGSGDTGAQITIGNPPVAVTSGVARYRAAEGWTRVGDPKYATGSGLFGHFIDTASGKCFGSNSSSSSLTVTTLDVDVLNQFLYVGGKFVGIDGLVLNHTAIFDLRTNEWVTTGTVEGGGGGMIGASRSCCVIQDDVPQPTLDGNCSDFTHATRPYCCVYPEFEFEQCCDPDITIGAYTTHFASEKWFVYGKFDKLGAANFTCQCRASLAYFDSAPHALKWVSLPPVLPSDPLSSRLGSARAIRADDTTLYVVWQNYPAAVYSIPLSAVSGGNESNPAVWTPLQAAWNGTATAGFGALRFAHGAPGRSLVAVGGQHGMAPQYTPAIARWVTAAEATPAMPAGWHQLPCVTALEQLGYVSDGYTPTVAFIKYYPPQPAPEPSPDGGGLSDGARAAIIVVSAVVGIVAIGAAVVWCRARSEKSDASMPLVKSTYGSNA